MSLLLSALKILPKANSLSNDFNHLSDRLGLNFNQIHHLKYALTHRSAGSNNNERLEFLGDAILGFAIAEMLYQKFPQADEGVLSRLRAELVNQTSLAGLARQLNLGEQLILGPGERKSGGYKRDSILSDALEALFGAIVEDQGTEACKQWILKLFSNRIARLSVQDGIKDPKTCLQELMQGKGLALPGYTLVSQSGLAHQQNFVVECSVSLLDKATLGTGLSRKRAEQDAAQKVLEQL